MKNYDPLQNEKIMKNFLILCIVTLLLASLSVRAQEKKPYPAPESGLNPKSFDPINDPNPDMFISHWEESMPDCIHGSLIIRDIFTQLQGNEPLRPKTRGAVLTDIKRFARGLLTSKTSTTPSILKGEQEVLYIDGGRGIIKAGKQTAELFPGIGVLVPEGLEFTMTNTADDPLTMYVIAESVPEGFKPNKEILVRDDNRINFGSSLGHWTHVGNYLFKKDDGLASMVGMASIWFDPMTMGQPHSHREGIEEIWFVLDSDVTVLQFLINF